VGINVNNPGADSLSVGGTARMNDNDIYLDSSDNNIGLGYYNYILRGFGAFGEVGPVLYGYDGGALGTTSGGSLPSCNGITWVKSPSPLDHLFHLAKCWWSSMPLVMAILGSIIQIVMPRKTSLRRTRDKCWTRFWRCRCLRGIIKTSPPPVTLGRWRRISMRPLT